MAWRKVMPALADEHTVVAVDMRGAGESALEASAYARTYPEQVRRLAVVEAGVPGFGLASLFAGSYHYRFHMVPELPERLIRGRERYYLTRFLCGEELDCKQASIDETLVDEHVRAYSRPGRLTAGLELYRALPRDAQANRARAAPRIHAGAGARWGAGDRHRAAGAAEPRGRRRDRRSGARR